MAREKGSLNRREALQHIGALGIGAVVTACGSGNGSEATNVPTATPTTAAPASTSTPTSAPTAPPTATSSPTLDVPDPTSTATVSVPTATVTPVEVACVLTPEQILGPFFIDVGLARSDIREDREGLPLGLTLQLVDVDGCAPIQDAVVNVWHADAGGAYSGFPAQPGGIDTTSETFLRGFQITDANGRVALTTIYPGWYPGRTVHIHVRIHIDATTILVTQLYFPETVNDSVLTQAPYNARGERSTTNATDGIFNADLLLEIAPEGEGYRGSIVLGVDLG